MFEVLLMKPFAKALLLFLLLLFLYSNHYNIKISLSYYSLAISNPSVFHFIINGRSSYLIYNYEETGT